MFINFCLIVSVFHVFFGGCTENEWKFSNAKPICNEQQIKFQRQITVTKGKKKIIVENIEKNIH